MKRFLSLLMTAMLVLSSLSFCFATGTIGTGLAPTPPSDSGSSDIAKAIIGAVQWVGYLIAAGMLVFIGTKYIVASASEKAELNGLLIKYVIGAVLIVFGTSIAGWIFSISTPGN